MNNSWEQLGEGWQISELIAGKLEEVSKNPAKFAFPGTTVKIRRSTKPGSFLQKAFYNVIHEKWRICQNPPKVAFPANPDPMLVVKERWLKYFYLPTATNPRHMILRAISNCQLLAGKVPPRVQAAWIKMIFHGWSTKLRTEQTYRPCYLCGMEKGDCFRHISCCKYTRALYRYFGVVPEGECYSNLYFYGCHSNLKEEGKLVISSLVLTGIYNALNKLRNYKLPGKRGLSLLGCVGAASEGVCALRMRQWRSLHYISLSDDSEFERFLNE